MLIKIIFVSTLIVLAYAKCRVCPDHPPLYDEIGCTPIKHGLHCPTSFTCPDFNSFNQNKCHYKGQSYNIGQALAKGPSSPSCSSGCTCRSSNGGASFACPVYDCFHGYMNASCTLVSTLNSCCPTRVCGDEAKNLPKCYYNGKTYTKGQNIEPPNSCYECICDENFDNSTSYKNNKNCQQINCGVELRDLDNLKEGCAPIIYGTDGCCPIDYRCPAAGDFIVPSPIPTTNTDPTMTCKFGKLTLQRFDNLNSTDHCISCLCDTPPMVQCIQQADCQSN